MHAASCRCEQSVVILALTAAATDGHYLATVTVCLQAMDSMCAVKQADHLCAKLSTEVGFYGDGDDRDDREAEAAEMQQNTSNTHTRLTALFPGLPRSAGTRKVKPIWILLKQETVSGSGISWALCKSATCSRQITMPALSFLHAGCPSCRPTNSVKALKATKYIKINQISQISWKCTFLWTTANFRTCHGC